MNGATLSYTPAANFFGTETFVYSMQDGLGTVTQATVTVTVTAQNDNPSVDSDSFAVTVDSVDNPLDVLANDSILPDAGESLSISNVSAPNLGGSVQIAAGGTSLMYTPPAGVEGVETFTYTVTDGNGGSAQGNVTINIQPEVIEPIVNFILEFTDENGDPIEAVDVGDNFQLRVSVQDARTVNPQGVFSAYLDVLYGGSANPMITGGIEFNDDVYDSIQKGSTATDGLIDELGALAGLDPLDTGDPILLATIPMTATSGGMITATSDPADQNPPNETTVYGLGRVLDNSEVVFGTDTLTVNGAVTGTAPFMNPSNPLDVNADSIVSPVDALLIINELDNGGGVLTGSISRNNFGAPNALPSYIDTNGDNILSPVDAVLVINELDRDIIAAAPLGIVAIADINGERSTDEITTDTSEKEAKVTSETFAEQEETDRLPSWNGSVQRSSQNVRQANLDQAWADGVDDIFGDELAEDIRDVWNS